MNIEKLIILKNGQEHEIKYGDVFDFDYKSLQGTMFDNSYFGKSLLEQAPDQVKVSFSQGEMGYFSGVVDYLKDNEVFDSFPFYEPNFLNYISGKRAFSFIENKGYESVVDPKNVEMNGVYKVSFDKFKSVNYLKKEKLKILEEKSVDYIIFHFFNMKAINPEMYANILTLIVYAVKNNEFINFDTPEEIEKEKEYAIRRNIKYDPEMAIVDYSFDSLSNNVVKFLRESNFLIDRICEFEGQKIKMSDVLQFKKNNI